MVADGKFILILRFTIFFAPVFILHRSENMALAVSAMYPELLRIDNNGYIWSKRSYDGYHQPRQGVNIHNLISRLYAREVADQESSLSDSNQRKNPNPDLFGKRTENPWSSRPLVRLG